MSSRISPTASATSPISSRVRRWIGGVTGVSSKVRSPAARCPSPSRRPATSWRRREARRATIASTLRRMPRMVNTQAGMAMRKMSASRASTSRRAPWKVALACMGQGVALGDLGVVEVLEVGVERVGGGIQALGGPLVGQLGRVGARDAEQLAVTLRYTARLCFRKRALLRSCGGGEGRGGQREPAGDQPVVGQDALLERALGLEGVLEDVAIGQRGVLADQRACVARARRAAGSRATKLRWPPSETLARLARLTMASATTSTPMKMSRPASFQRSVMRRGTARTGSRAGEDASPCCSTARAPT